jgi:hypothetical protein
VFHVELRQFPNQTRAFNLTREELDARILTPWVTDGAVELGDRRWSSERAKLTIYEGPELAPDQVGLGRGWANVTRSGEDVTARLLAEVAHPPPVADFKRAVAAGEPISLPRLIERAGERFPQARVSERLALCEQAVWELLHEGAVTLVRAGAAVNPDAWQETLLSWQAWRDESVVLQATRSSISRSRSACEPNR